MRYIALIHKDPDSAYGVSFPDLPGCIATGDSIDAAVRSATEALAGHIMVMEADGDAVPDPRTIEQLLADAEFEEDKINAVVTAIALIRDLGSTTRINVSLDMGLLKAIDSEAQARGQTRSAFIASAVRNEIRS